MSPAGPEKRIYPRKRLRTQVIFEDETGEGFIYFYSTDISLGGLFFESDVPLKVGTRIFLSFSLEEGERLVRATGQVIRVEREAGAGFVVVGVGIKFGELPDQARMAIERYVNS